MTKTEIESDIESDIIDFLKTYELNEDLVISMLETSPNLNINYVSTEDGNTILTTALIWTHENVARWILEHRPDVDINHANKKKITALILAGDMRDIAISILNTRPDVDINYVGGVEKFSALLTAIYYRKPKVARYILENRPDVDINHQNLWQHTALRLAIIERMEDIAYLILETRPDLDIHHDTKQWGLIFQTAAFHKCTRITCMMLDMRPDMNIYDSSYGTTTLTYLHPHNYTYKENHEPVQHSLDKFLQRNARRGLTEYWIHHPQLPMDLIEEIVSCVAMTWEDVVAERYSRMYSYGYTYIPIAEGLVHKIKRKCMDIISTISNFLMTFPTWIQ